MAEQEKIGISDYLITAIGEELRRRLGGWEPALSDVEEAGVPTRRAERKALSAGLGQQ